MKVKRGPEKVIEMWAKNPSQRLEALKRTPRTRSVARS
jgi:hypothetical protein